MAVLVSDLREKSHVNEESPLLEMRRGVGYFVK
jgi:hypothetical protein